MPRNPHLAPPDSPDAAATEGKLGLLAQLRGDYDSAERSYRQALDTFTKLGDRKNMSIFYHELGTLAQAQGDYDTAEHLHRRALDIFELIGDQGGMSASYHHLGILAQERGDYDTAEHLYHRSLKISERIGDQAGVATCYAALALPATAKRDREPGDPETCECPGPKGYRGTLYSGSDSGPSSIGSRLPSRHDCSYAYGDQRCHRSKRWRTTCLCGLCG